MRQEGLETCVSLNPFEASPPQHLPLFDEAGLDQPGGAWAHGWTGRYSAVSETSGLVELLRACRGPRCKGHVHVLNSIELCRASGLAFEIKQFLFTAGSKAIKAALDEGAAHVDQMI